MGGGQRRVSIVLPKGPVLLLCTACLQKFFSTAKGAFVGVKKTGKGRRKIGRKKRRMRARIRHRKK